VFWSLHQVFLTTICGVLMCGVHVFIYHINAFGMGITLFCASILSQFAINICVGPCFYLSYQCFWNGYTITVHSCNVPFNR